MPYRQPRYTGSVGDSYKVVDEDYANQRSGCDQPKLVKGDVLVSLRHSGDCFSDYAILRNEEQIGEWCGYDGAGEFLHNVAIEYVVTRKVTKS